MKVLLTGASGNIGTSLKAELAAQGHDVRIMTRQPGGDYTWNARPGSVPDDSLSWADAVVSLNGASLTHLPWTSAYRDQIMTSRVQATTALAKAIARADDPPRVWVSASAVGIYGDRGDAALDESALPGAGFLADVVRAWEQSTKPAQEATRVVLARTGLVLGTEGVLNILGRVTKFGLGARVGPGTQWWPWIWETDEARAIAFALEQPALSGPVNLAAPKPATSDEITRAIAQAMRRPYVFKIPAPVIRAAMGDAQELMLFSQRVIPQALVNAGFKFQYDDAASAIGASRR